MNPPYGTDPIRGTRIADWFARITQASCAGSQIMALVPVAPNTQHWKQHVFPVASAVCFLYAPRLRFYLHGQEDPRGAPMACAVVYYGSDLRSFADEFRQHGAVISLSGISLPNPPLTAATSSRPPVNQPVNQAANQAHLGSPVRAESLTKPSR